MRTRDVSQAAVLALLGLAVLAPGGAARGGGYHIGLDFLDQTLNYSWRYYMWPVYPYDLTDPTQKFVGDGGLGGWSEEQARRAVALWVEDRIRNVDTPDPATTLALAVYEGLVPQSVGGRRLNVALGGSVSFETAYGFTDGVGCAYDQVRYPNDGYVAAVFLNNIAALPGVSYDTANKVFNSVGGTTAHEIGHVFGLQHEARGDTQPYPIMATGSTGLTPPDRLTLREYGEVPGTQEGGHSSSSYLVAHVGTAVRGDFDFSGSIDIEDAGVLIGSWQAADALYQMGDADSNHRVDIDDAGVLIGHFGAAGDSAAPAGDLIGNFGATFDAAGAGTAHLHYDAANHRLQIDAADIAWLKVQASDGGQLAADGYDPILDMFSTVQQPNAGNSFAAGEFITGNFISGTGYANLAIEAGEATVWYKTLGGTEFSQTIGIPEPGTLVILALGGLGVLLRRRRRLAA